MKRTTLLFTLLITGACLFSCASKDESGYADLASHDMGEVVGEAETIPGIYGEKIAESISVTQLPDMVEKVEANGSYETTIKGEIKEVCTKKGCWLTMDLPNGKSMRVTFKDYGFFVPTNSQGFPIILEGVATLSETDVETLRHYAEDEGLSKQEIEAIKEPKKEITFEAKGVIIPGKA